MIKFSFTVEVYNPENMRNLEYVHFIDEELGIPESISNLGWEELKKISSSNE